MEDLMPKIPLAVVTTRSRFRTGKDLDHHTDKLLFLPRSVGIISICKIYIKNFSSEYKVKLYQPVYLLKCV